MYVCVYIAYILYARFQLRINQEAFIKSFEKFRYCRAEILKLHHISPFECPACHKRQHSAHIDGNKKLYRFSKVAR